jgi:centromeric protein E
MEGYHGTVFAYGMTGTGKTFSMQGTATSPGVIPLAITDIFSFIRETPHREFLLRVSYLEIYNEKIHDLLSAPVANALGQPAQQEEIKLREDPKRGVYATPLKEEIVQSPTQLLRVIARGDQARRVAGTQYNARSSRSHAVVQIVVESRERVPGTGSLGESKRAAILPGGVRVSTLSLIDLAGSEKAAESKERRTEGAHINKSLLTLGTVIANLSGDKDKAADSKDKTSAKHLPYRDSKLTRLLQPALSGNSLVSILCTIQIGSVGSAATATTHTGETLNTLKFASRAKNNIVSHAKKAEEAFGAGVDAGSIALLDRYRKEISDLRKQLEEQKDAKVKEQDEQEEKAREREAEVRHGEQLLEMQLARTALKERIEHLNRLILSSKSLGVNAGRSFSALSMRNTRASILSNGEGHPVSARSSTSHATLEVPNQGRVASGGSAASFGISPTNLVVPETGSEEDDSLGDNGDGMASASVQIRALQADLADKTRYISTLEKRLLQARRSSQSRVSMSLSHRLVNGNGGEEVADIIKEKDAEIAELRAMLDDKDKMIGALRSAARKRDVADLKIDTGITSTPTPTPTSHSHSNSLTSSRRNSSMHQRNANGSSASDKITMRDTPMSPVAFLAPHSKKNSHSGGAVGGPVNGISGPNAGVEGLTKILDEMISERAGAPDGGFGSLPVAAATPNGPKGLGISRRVSVRATESR